MIDFDLDESVRQMLHERAQDVHPSPDGWDRILDRLEGEPVPVLTVHRARRVRRLTSARLITLTSIAAAFLVAVGVGAVVLRGEGTRRGGDNVVMPPADTEGTTTPVPAPAQGFLPVWPLDGGLDDEQLAQPRDAVAAYLSEKFGKAQPFSVGQFEAAAEGSGRVTYTSPPGSAKTGSVYVQQGKGQSGGDVWYVMSADSEGLNVHMADYNGTTLNAEAAADGDGPVKVVITMLDAVGTRAGTDRFDEAARRDRPVQLRRDVPGADSLLVEVRQTDSKTGAVYLAELRVPSAAADSARRPAPPRLEDAVGVVQAWLRAAEAFDDAAMRSVLHPDSPLTADASRDAHSMGRNWLSQTGMRDVEYGAAQIRPGVAVVFMTGSDPAEGTPNYMQIRAIPVRADDTGAWKVQPWVVDGSKTVFGGEELDAENPFSGPLPKGAKRAWFVVDGAVHIATIYGDEARLEGGVRLGKGRHAVTLVAEDDKGRLRASALLFTTD